MVVVYFHTYHHHHHLQVEVDREVYVGAVGDGCCC